MIQTIHGGDIYRHPDVLDFSANINPLGTPPSVIAAAKAGLEKIANYPDVKKEALIRALSCYEQIPENWLICGNGAAELIFSLVLALKPQKALLLAPTFAEYEQALSANRCEVNYFYLKEETGFVLGSDFLDAITEDLDLLFLCNPNNPTGALIDGALLEAIQDRCAKNTIFLVLDECFVDFVAQPEQVTKKSSLSKYANLFILKAFTKRYAMAGIRLGYGMTANQELLAQMNRVTQPWNISIPAQEAGVAALQEQAYVEQARDLIFTEQQYLKEQLCVLGFKVYDSKANYIFFKGPKGFAAQTVAQGIMIRDCSNYPGLEDGFYRIAVRTHEENEQLVHVFRKLRCGKTSELTRM